MTAYARNTPADDTSSTDPLIDRRDPRPAVTTTTVASYIRAKRITELAELLVAAGYCGTSNRYTIVTRIDRRYWMETLLNATQLRITPEQLSPNAYSCWAEHYIRRYSADSIEGIGEETYREVRRLMKGPPAYVPIVGAVKEKTSKLEWYRLYFLTTCLWVVVIRFDGNDEKIKAELARIWADIQVAIKGIPGSCPPIYKMKAAIYASPYVAPYAPAKKD